MMAIFWRKMDKYAAIQIYRKLAIYSFANMKNAYNLRTIERLTSSEKSTTELHNFEYS